MAQFIETQFPIARLSAESYKERKANVGQTLTRLGKWWGRKPLILVRACILGMLMPASSNPKKDREIFLKLLTMDDDGAWQRNRGKIKNRSIFDALPYSERIIACVRPENISGPLPDAWADINKHLGTNATCLSEVVQQLGQIVFGHKPRIGDSFCGGGSIPFEAARVGCDAFGSDLNPIAGLLTWASLNILGGGVDIQEEIIRIQTKVLNLTDRQITDWGIERNSRGERADAYLYCVEVKPEGCDYFIPLAPSWMIGERSRVIAKWHRVSGSDRLEPEIEIVSESELKQYKNKKGATVIDSRIVDPFNPSRSWSIEAVRGPDGLRRWSNEDLVHRPSDVFQERLYCIRWIDANGTTRYAAPEPEDIEREAKVLGLLRERFGKWQREGFIPSMTIPEDGAETARVYKERGWSHWHHLFTPRQLLVHGVIAENATKSALSLHSTVACLLGIGRVVNWNSRLSQWLSDSAHEGGNHVFYSQTLNSFYNYSNRPLTKLDTAWFLFSKAENISVSTNKVEVADARDIREHCDLWITDPPYADAVNYHELGDFFLAWCNKILGQTFPTWTPDSRAELAVRGDGEDFRRSMVEIYQNLAKHMPDNGLQLVMFTHQNPGVWADLGMILWAAGLKVTAAWTISTETEAAGIKKGNYVQGTVCLVLRKRLGDEPSFLDEVYPMVEDEVRKQIDSMQALDEGAEPNFNDADYQLAAYAAALKVLTQFSKIDGRDVEHEVFAVRGRNEKSDFQTVIERALEIACDYLVPKGLDRSWRDLSLTERYYLRALDIESRGERRKGMYEELARGFGVTDIRPMLESDKANGARMKTPSDLGSTTLGAIKGSDSDAMTLPGRRTRGNSGSTHPFAPSPLRHLLFSIRETAAADNNPEIGRQYLRDTFGPLYWNQRARFVGLLEWIAQLGNAAGMEKWHKDSEAARILLGRLRNDQA